MRGGDERWGWKQGWNIRVRVRVGQMRIKGDAPWDKRRGGAAANKEREMGI